jgi:hypothetical protein
MARRPGEEHAERWEVDMKTWGLLFAVLVGIVTWAAADELAKSRDPARKLVQLLEARRLTAAATTDPQVPGRFIAAMYVPGSGLLVVGASSPSVEAVRYRIEQRQYRDVYLDLQSTPTVQGRLFVQDAAADGLTWSADGSDVDVAHEDGARTTLFTNQRAKGAAQTYARTDAEYARMLSHLVASLEQVAAPQQLQVGN